MILFKIHFLKFYNFKNKSLNYFMQITVKLTQFFQWKIGASKYDDWCK